MVRKRFLVPLVLCMLAVVMINVNKRLLIVEDRPTVGPNLVQAIQRVDPSVVYVEAYSHSEGHSYDGGGDYKIWSGSGVIISENGIVLTAAHVVSGADKFKMTLPDGREFWSESSWDRSDISDVGFIKIDANGVDLPISYLGESANLRRGDDVFIIGCPFGYDLRFTVTKGIVSSFKRDFDGFFGEKMLMQVDAQSWPGNSGGPVYDMRGQVIGILVGGYYGADGIGLVVPVDVIRVLRVMYDAEQLLEVM